MRTVFVEHVEAPEGCLPGWRETLRACGRCLGVGPGEVAVLLCDDAEMSALNGRFLGKAGPTDVLSFPDHTRGPEGTVHIGDIAVSLETARRQARAARRGLDLEVRRLLIHGLLHLLGYDHERDDGEMEALERDLRRRLLAAAR